MVDYGRFPMANGSLPNRDPETGIRYGIVSLNDLNEYTLDCFEPVYSLSCPACGNEIEEVPENCTCEHCDYNAERDDEWYPDDPNCWKYDGEGYYLILNESNDIWVFKSPHTTTKWSHCSPCAPGAAYLDNGEEHENDPAYCLGPEWYDES